MMGKRLGRVVGFAVVLTVVVAGSACNKSKSNDADGQGLDNGGLPPGMDLGGPGGSRRPIREAMTKIFKGPASLKDSIGRELNSDSPSWETIQPQAQEFAQLAATLSNYDPPKGSKESWAKLTAIFSDSATALEHAANAKNKDDALAAHAALSNNQTCKACHQAHRGGPGGMGRSGRSGPPAKN
jgi:hypothetical protein